MADDPDFRDYRIATYRYDSPLLGRTSTIQEVSTRMLQELEGVFRKYNEIYFIAHSMGGIVTKRVLVNLNNPADIQKLRLIKAVLYIATPAQGADLADLGVWLSLNPQFSDMRSANSNSYLQNLEDEWANLIRQRRDEWFPRCFSAYETKPLVGRMIVSRISAITYCDQNAAPIDEDHISIVKPTSTQSSIYKWAANHVRDSSQVVRGFPSSASNQKRIEDQLKRIEFLQERGKQTGTVKFFVQLKRPFAPDELGHFRILLEMIGPVAKDKSPTTLSFAARDAYLLFPSSASGQLQKRDGTQQHVWSKNPAVKFKQLAYSGGSAFGPNMSLIQVLLENVDDQIPFPTIESLNQKGLSIFVSESLADKMAGIGFAVGNYLLIGLPIDCLEQTKRNPAEWPFQLSQSEQAIGWLNLLPIRYWPDDNSRPPFRPTLVIDFDRFIPVKADPEGSWSISADCELSKAEPLPPR
jgi:hypothetical protein